MISRLPRVALVAALACSLGLHWGLLQTVAWVGMLVSCAQDAPIGDAVVKTFDGKHPCPLCKQIAQGKRSERTSSIPLPGKKFEFSYSKAAFVFSAPIDYWEVHWPEQCFSALSRTPPTPPPRRLHA
ncbi:MAG TPA: hypothetical protein VMU04_22155 [Candidatus Acidoferrum sp.]|nr:hypothetical protein [Candidatus Acidoferrum sp.]